MVTKVREKKDYCFTNFDKFIEVVDTFVNFLIKNVNSKIQNLKVMFRIYPTDNQLNNRRALLFNFEFIIFNFRFKSVNYFCEFDKLVKYFASFLSVQVKTCPRFIGIQSSVQTKQNNEKSAPSPTLFYPIYQLPANRKN